MIKRISIGKLLALSLLFLLSGCSVPGFTGITKSEPVYMSYEDLRSAISVQESEVSLDNPSKIYLYEDYLLINDKNKGVHVYDNIRPYQPRYIGFINIPGNLDIEVKNGILYADSFIDLVAIDLSQFPDITETKRIQDAFPYDKYQAFDENVVFESVDPEQGVVIGAIEITTNNEEDKQ